MSTLCKPRENLDFRAPRGANYVVKPDTECPAGANFEPTGPGGELQSCTCLPAMTDRTARIDGGTSRGRGVSTLGRGAPLPVRLLDKPSGHRRKVSLVLHLEVCELPIASCYDPS